ncbi:MAG: hypothetical protein F4Y02_11710 [Chloroflexi bacterium]|nr:hypothetical protein [Chloroflexota bacterium]
MNDMSPADFQALAAIDPHAAIAIAQFALVQSISLLVHNTSLLVDIALTLAIAKLVVGLTQVAVIWHAINRMSKDSERRHAEFTARHRKDMKSLDALIRRSGGRRGIDGTRHIGRRYP